MTTRLNKLRSRRLDPLIKVGEINEVYKHLTSEDSAVQYAIGAMQPIDSDYTKKSIEERSRVEKQLSDGYVTAGLGVDFDYQGSVTNNTHIRAHSDLDLLAVERRFYVLQPPNVPAYPYKGDAVADLREIRKNAASILKTSYPKALVDESGSKAITISGGSLSRKIDVIPSAWWHTVEYVRDSHKYWIGIEILDNDKSLRITNKPFLHNKRIDERDTLANGGLRKLVRLLKSLKYDSDNRIDISSYDIVGIVYNMPDNLLISQVGFDLVLVKNCQAFLHFLIQDQAFRGAMETPNKMRKVFCDEGATELSDITG